jgi:hypothetical protein
MNVFRISPKLPVQAMKTYQVSSPISTHTRPATCAEVECRPHTQGWATAVDERTELGQRQAYYIRKESGRSFREERTEKGWTAFTFPAGQRCFDSASHRVPLDRPEFYIVRSGDWRGSPLGLIRRHTRPEHWVEDFALHQQGVAKMVERG